MPDDAPPGCRQGHPGAGPADAVVGAGQRRVIALGGSIIFLSAFLLFLVQPILAKLILPRYGGSVAVWATCLVFFQSSVLIGYACAHQIVRLGHKGGVRTAHLGLLLASLALLPIVPLPAWPLPAGVGPGVGIFLLLVVTIGLPFTLLATTSPLLQSWLSRDRPGHNPYRLFAVSNLASLGALAAYPWLIEPWLRTATQAVAWSVAYGVYVVLLCLLSVVRRRLPGAAAAQLPASGGEAAPGRLRMLGWIALAGLGSYELVAITNHLTQNIPSFPMMWVLPLALYLLSFALCFDNDRWVAPRLFAAATWLALLVMSGLLLAEREVKDLRWPIAGFLTGLFVVCMFCHGELARARPAPRWLTQFYLCVSLGGVLGGAVVGLAAPVLLPGYFEVEIGLVLLALALWWRSRSRQRWWSALCLLAVLGTAAVAAYRIDDTLSEVVLISRNFYGVLRVREYGSADQPQTLERELVHGRIMHGQQFLAAPGRHQPSGYYTETSGIGRLLRALAGRPIEVGLVGLGAGTLAVYGKPGDRYRFYEIDAAIADAANRYFSFLADSPARVELVIGDGRLLLQAEDTQRFDVLVIDAFSGDSIPVHLLTREALTLYRERVKPDGVVALHLSNSHLDLRPVVADIAAELGLQLSYVQDPPSDAGNRHAASAWILLAADRSLLDLPVIREAASELPKVKPAAAWTDDYSNILQVMSFSRGSAGP